MVPWGKLLTSANLWLLCLMYFCAAYGWYINITYFPGYLKDPLGIEKGTGEMDEPVLDRRPDGGACRLLVGSVACLIGGFLTDVFIKRTGNRKWGRRLFGVIGHGLCACATLSRSFS